MLVKRLAAIVLLAIAAPAVALAQYADCRPPLKEAAGACVAQCPAGYADNGRYCTYRNSSH